MKPTNTLRWIRREIKATHSAMNALAPKQFEKVLQQWWEGAKIKKEYDHLDPGSIIPWDGESKLLAYEPYGEWRDVPVEEE